MLIGVLQLTERTLGCDCLEIVIEDGCIELLRSKGEAITLRGTVTQAAPLRLAGVEPSPPTYLKLRTPVAYRDGFKVERLITPPPFMVGAKVEFLVIRD